MKKIIFCFILFIFTMNILHAEDKQIPNNITESYIQQKQIEVLKAQLDSSQKYQDQFISIVLWSLGSLVTMTLGLIAFNWYSNKISYERDINLLKQESEAYIASLEIKLKNEISIRNDDLLEKLAKKENEIKSKIEQELSKKINNHSSLIEQNRCDILKVKYEVVKNQAEIAENENRFEWAIYLYCDLLDISVKAKTDYYKAGELLDSISSLLDKPGYSLSADNLNKAITTLQNLPNSHKNAAELIIHKINKIHGKDA